MLANDKSSDHAIAIQLQENYAQEASQESLQISGRLESSDDEHRLEKITLNINRIPLGDIHSDVDSVRRRTPAVAYNHSEERDDREDQGAPDKEISDGFSVKLIKDSSTLVNIPLDNDATEIRESAEDPLTEPMPI